ncbi:MAG: hypothetical protein ACT4PT_13215 [Methanobacteriota archaeon]
MASLRDAIDVSEFEIEQELYLSFLVMLALVVASYLAALAWQRWRDRRRYARPR